MTCKYCDAYVKDGKGDICEKCRNKLPSVKKLMQQIEQMKELKARKNMRERNELFYVTKF